MSSAAPATSEAPKIYGLVGLMVLLWSGNYIVAKVALREVPPVLLMSLRMTVSGAIMVPIFWRELHRRVVPITRRDIAIWLLLGIGGVAANQFFFVLGLSKTTVTHGAMIVASTPVWVLLAAALLGMEKVTAPKVIGIALAISGVAILQIFRPKISPNGPTLLGDATMLFSTLAFASMTVFGKRWNPGRSSIAVNSVGYIGGALLLAPLGWWATRTFDLRQISWAAWGGVLYMAAFSSVLCYLIFYWALQRLPASRLAAFQYLQPFFATLMAVFLLGEELTLPSLVSGGIIFTGLFLTERFG